MASTNTYDVFLSYSAEDQQIVRRLAERLRGNQLRVFFDKTEIPPGHNYVSVLDRALSNSKCLVICVSRHWARSKWAAAEWQSFLVNIQDPGNMTGRMILLRLDDTPISGLLSAFSHIDFRSDRHRAYARLLLAVRQASIDEPIVDAGPPEVGDIYDSVVTSVTTFGAFVELKPGYEALVHVTDWEDAEISEFDEVSIDLKQRLRIGQTLTVKVLSIDEMGRIRVTRKAGSSQSAR